jgi:hypothetical protein
MMLSNEMENAVARATMLLRHALEDEPEEIPGRILSVAQRKVLTKVLAKLHSVLECDRARQDKAAGSPIPAPPPPVVQPAPAVEDSPAVQELKRKAREIYPHMPGPKEQP